LNKILNSGLSDSQIESELLNIIYERKKENMMTVFLQIQDLDKKRVQQENNLLYRGLEDGMHSLAGLSRELLDGKTKLKLCLIIRWFSKTETLLT